MLPGPHHKLSTEGKRTEPYENLNLPLIHVDHEKSTTIMTTNIIAALTNTPKPTHLLGDDNIDNAPQNTLATKSWNPPSKILYAVDIAFDEEIEHVASPFH